MGKISNCAASLTMLACALSISANKVMQKKYIRLFPQLSVAWVCAGLLASSGLVCAQNQASSVSGVAPAGSPSFVIKGFDIVGANPLSEGEVSRLLAPYLRVDATMETLQKATQALEALLKDHGYALHRVVLPPQEVGHSVTLNIIKFVIGKVTIEGRSDYSEANIRNSLPELTQGAAPNFRTLAVQTAIANESQGKQVQVTLKESEDPDKIDARVIVKESKPWNLSLNVANTGSQATGKDRFTVAVGHANVADLDHALTLAFTTSLERTSDVKQLGVNYRVPLYRMGGVVGASFTQSDVLGDFGAFKSTGAGQTAGLNYNHYLAPSDGFRRYLTVGLDDKQFNITQINGVPLAGQAVRRSLPLSFGYTARMESDAAFWGYNVELAANVPGGTGNDVSAYQTEDTRITTTNWSALRGAANYAAGLGGGWLWGGRGQFQFSPVALISGEQFGVGGAASVRGVGERPMSGDSGVTLVGEVTSPELVPGWRALGFVDTGWLGNNNPNVNKLSSDSVASVGFGLRYSLPSLSISADYGRVVQGSSLPETSGLAVPRKGDDKLHVNLTARF
jgi:hemolysin activation/secretion protein